MKYEDKKLGILSKLFATFGASVGLLILFKILFKIFAPSNIYIIFSNNTAIAFILIMLLTYPYVSKNLKK